MLKRLIILIFTGTLLVSLGSAPATATFPRGDIYERGTYDDPYSFVDDECGFAFKVKGRTTGHFITYNVPGSDGQAFLAHDWYFFREKLTNPANGKRMYISGTGYFREVAARHVEGNLWEFDQIDSGRPFVVRNSKGRIVLIDHGKRESTILFDTLGDSQPGGEFIKDISLKITGSFPSWEPGFDFCRMVRRLIG